MGEIEERYGGFIEREGMQFYGERKRRETHFGVNRRENRILMFSIRYHRLISIPFKTKKPHYSMNSWFLLLELFLSSLNS